MLFSGDGHDFFPLLFAVGFRFFQDFAHVIRGDDAITVEHAVSFMPTPGFGNLCVGPGLNHVAYRTSTQIVQQLAPVFPGSLRLPASLLWASAPALLACHDAQARCYGRGLPTLAQGSDRVAVAVKDVLAHPGGVTLIVEHFLAPAFDDVFNLTLQR